MENENKESSLVKKVLIFSLLFAFLAMGIVAMKRAMPEPKEERIYTAIKVYSPYAVEQSIGGLTIIDKRDDTKEKPSAAEVLHRLDELDKAWGKKNLSIENNDVLIKKDDNSTVKIFMETSKEKEFVKNFFGI